MINHRLQNPTRVARRRLALRARRHTDQGVSMLRLRLDALAEHYGRQADRCRRKARIWLALAILFGIGALIALADLIHFVWIHWRS